jgi:hypothetical protein
LVIDVEPAAAVIDQLGACAKQLHVYPRSRNS